MKALFRFFIFLFLLFSSCILSPTLPHPSSSDYSLVKINIGISACAAFLIRPNIILTAAHCSRAHLPNINDTAKCGVNGDSAIILKWVLHPNSGPNTQTSDLALGLLSRPLDSCYKSTNISAPITGETLTFAAYGLSGSDGIYKWLKVSSATIEGISLEGQHIVVDASPDKFCRGESGTPIYNNQMEVIGLVSHGPLTNDGCSSVVHLVGLAPNQDWIEKTIEILEK